MIWVGVIVSYFLFSFAFLQSGMEVSTQPVVLLKNGDSQELVAIVHTKTQFQQQLGVHLIDQNTAQCSQLF